MWRSVWKMRVKAAVIVKALERYLSDVVPTVRHTHAETSILILIRIKQDLEVDFTT